MREPRENTDRDKLTPAQVRRIKKLVSRGATQRTLAFHYGVHPVIINRICRDVPKLKKRKEKNKKYKYVQITSTCLQCGKKFSYKTWRPKKVKEFCSHKCTSLSSYYARKPTLNKMEWARKQIALLKAAGLFVPKRLRDIAQ